MNTLGKCCRKASCLLVEKTAPPEPTLKTELRSQRPGLSSNASSSGTAMASPTMVMALTFSRATMSQISSPTRECAGFSTTVLPANSWIHAYHQQAPCISGASAMPIIGKSPTRSAICSGAEMAPSG